MNSVVQCSSSEAIEGLLKLIKAESPIVDVTWGNGVFWKNTSYTVFGGDLDKHRAKDFVADFLVLPFKSVPTVVYDPPFHPYVNSAEEARFKGMGQNEKELKTLFMQGLAECWKITKNHLIVKCQGFVHNHQPQWMPLWAIEVCGEPFEWLVVVRHKRISGKWVNSFSLRRNHSDYLVFNKGGNVR